MKNNGTGLLIKHKIWAGFGLLVVVLAVVVGIAFNSLSSTEHKVEQVVDKQQPAVLAAMTLASQIESVSASLGYYLLSREEDLKQAYVDDLARLNTLLVELEGNALVREQASLQKKVAAVKDDIKKLNGYKDRMIELAGNQGKNVPASVYAAENLNPISQEMLNMLSQMLLSETDEAVSSERRDLLMDINELRYSWTNVMNGVRAYLAYRQQGAYDEVEVHKERVISLVAKVKGYADLLTLDQDDAINRFEARSADFYKNLEIMAGIHGGEKWRMDSYLIRTELSPLRDKVQSHLSDLSGALRGEIERDSRELLDEVGAAKSAVSVLAIVGVLIGIAGALIMSAVITRPINLAVSTMKDIAEGEGDLTRRLNVAGRDEIGQLAEAFNSFVEKIHDVVSKVSGSVTQLAAAAEQMSVITSETSEGVGRQRMETDQVATAINEMSATAQEVARNATGAAEAADGADTETRNGQRVVSSTTQAMNALAAEVERAAEVIQKVEQDSERIGTVLYVIKDIAEQTNLLALNAAIEAARAGEQGRGFAVVADEVRTLASRTQQSTQEIQDMIEELQAGTRDAVVVMTESRDRAQSGVDQAAQAASSLESIAAAVNSITEMNTQIASAAEEQSAVVEEINRNVVSISQVADQTSDGAQQLAGASNELAQLSAQLQNLVGQFKIAG